MEKVVGNGQRAMKTLLGIATMVVDPYGRAT